MASIRARITGSYALALAGTMLVFALMLSVERRTTALRDLQVRAQFVADLGLQLLSLPTVTNEPVTVTTDSLAGRQLSQRDRARLDALPEYVIVGDSVRAIFVSSAVRRLTPDDSTQLTTAAFNLTAASLSLKVRLDSDEVVLVARFAAPGDVGVTRRVVAGVSTKPLGVVSAEVLTSALVTIPLILLVSAIVAWIIAGNTLQPIARMTNDVEAITDGRSLHRRIPVEELGDEIGRLGETLNAMIGRLEGSFAALRRFTADASHELKTPLAVLRADIERAMTAPQRSTEQLVALEEALQETTRMAGLVESLLTLARADEGRFDLHREPVALDALVRDVSETAHILGEDAGIAVAVGAVESVQVLGDAERLRQLFLNLITNAIKYTAREGSVDLSLATKDGAAVFTVKDTGIGIAGADLPFIFERFWRVDRARSRSERAGVGLGLAISQWIAQAHGGSISVSSRLGRGSTFAVTIPAMPRDAAG